MPRLELAAMGERAREAVHQHYSKERLCAEFCDIVRAMIERMPATAASVPVEAA
jgi:hypothetical protein